MGQPVHVYRPQTHFVLVFIINVVDILSIRVYVRGWLTTPPFRYTQPRVCPLYYLTTLAGLMGTCLTLAVQPLATERGPGAAKGLQDATVTTGRPATYSLMDNRRVILATRHGHLPLRASIRCTGRQYNRAVAPRHCA